MLEVVFKNKLGETLTRYFDSEYLCRIFVNKLKHSKTCVLISHPTFRW